MAEPAGAQNARVLAGTGSELQRYVASAARRVPLRARAVSDSIYRCHGDGRAAAHPHAARPWTAEPTGCRRLLAGCALLQRYRTERPISSYLTIRLHFTIEEYEYYKEHPNNLSGRRFQV